MVLTHALTTQDRFVAATGWTATRSDNTAQGRGLPRTLGNGFPYNPSTPAGLDMPPSIVEPRWGSSPYAHTSQGALRDPVLCCRTPLEFSHPPQTAEIA